MAWNRFVYHFAYSTVLEAIRRVPRAFPVSLSIVVEAGGVDLWNSIENT
jgi:hypothetical protein